MVNNAANVVYIVALAFQYSWIVEVAANTSRWRYFLEEPISPPRAYDNLISTSKEQGCTGVRKGGNVSGSVGLGNYVDLMYTVPVQLGNTMVALHLDTGSSDLWVVSDKCTANACEGAQVTRYLNSSLASTGIDLDMYYGDSTTGSYASGILGLETVSVAGVTMTQQPFALVDDTNNHIVGFDAAGILGLSFPSASRAQEELTAKTGSLVQTDHFVASSGTSGPLLSRLAMSGALESPMFTVEFQRNAIDVSGRGALTIGKLPDGVDNSSLTWVPVRLYSTDEGGLPAPSFAPNEVYPYRWEVEIDGVFLDGERLADSTIPAEGVDSHRVSALIDTGNSVLRGPDDVVKNILSSVSDESYHPETSHSRAALPCSVPRSLAFQIGGKMFPIDPRDFISQLESNNSELCQADNLVATDAPSVGALFRWSLGTPFFRSNFVAFYYGNLTHPSADPPRIGFLSAVPDDAHQLLQDAVQNATLNGGNFPYAVEPAPTAIAALQPQITVSADMEYVANPTSTETHPLSAQRTGSPKKQTSGVANLAHAHGYLLILLEFVILLSFYT